MARVAGREQTRAGTRSRDRRSGAAPCVHSPACDGTSTTPSRDEPCCVTSGPGVSSATRSATPTPSCSAPGATSARTRPTPCPVCGHKSLRLVSYVYGDALARANGRCITSLGELERLDAAHEEFTRYVVEVCLDCHWNHLQRHELHGRRHAG